MGKRIVRLAVAAGFLVLMSGCVEMTQTVTLNPNGSGKVEYDVLAPADLSLGFLNLKIKDRTPDGLKQEAVQKFLTGTKGVTAWKDVTVRWAPDGRLHFRGTAYFDRLEDIETSPEGGTGGGAPALPLGSFRARLEDGELLTITIKNSADPKPNADNPMPPDPVKGTAAEWDDFVLRQRINYQKVRPIMVLLLTDVKIKTVFRLPGEVKESQGFKRDGTRVVSHLLDGNDLLAFMKKANAQDVAHWKKLVQAGVNVQQTMGLPPEFVEPRMTVHQLGKGQFDYAREVAEARENYFRLREQFKLDPNKKLPGEP
jgi:hypothetical protein